MATHAASFPFIIGLFTAICCVWYVRGIFNPLHPMANLLEQVKNLVAYMRYNTDQSGNNLETRKA